jgi:hypothetical protein
MPWEDLDSPLYFALSTRPLSLSPILMFFFFTFCSAKLLGHCDFHGFCSCRTFGVCLFFNAFVLYLKFSELGPYFLDILQSQRFLGGVFL